MITDAIKQRKINGNVYLSHLVKFYLTRRSHLCVISIAKKMISKLIISVFSIWIFLCFTKGAPRRARHLGEMSGLFMPKMDSVQANTYLFAVLSVSFNSVIKDNIKRDCYEAIAKGQKQTSRYQLSAGGKTCETYTATQKTILTIGQGSSGSYISIIVTHFGILNAHFGIFKAKFVF